MNREFKRGFKSAFSFVINDRTRERIPSISTEDRIRRNWESVGNDLRKAMGELDVELKDTKETKAAKIMMSKK